MKIRPLFYILLFSSFLLSSCQTENEFNDYKEIESGIWKNEEKIRFPFEIQNDDTLSLGMSLRLGYAFPANSFKIQAILYKGEKGILANQMDVRIKDENGQYLGEILGDLVDLKWVVFPHQALEKGSYTIEFMPVSYKSGLPYVLEVGAYADR